MSAIIELRKYIDDKCHELYAEWQCKLILPAYIGSNHYQKCDVLQYAGNKIQKGIPTKVSFCPKQYPIESNFKGKGFKSLYKALVQSALDQGFKLVMNGNFQVCT